MVAKQRVILEQPARAVHDEGESPTKRYLDALQKLQRALQEPGCEPSLTGEVVAPDGLATLLPAWEELCRRSVEDNVYYSPRYAQALLQSAERKQNVRFAIVWNESRLVALLPVTSPKF